MLLLLLLLLLLKCTYLSDTDTLNVAEALYTVITDNGKQCSGLKNHWSTKLEWYRNVFSSCRNVMRDDADCEQL